MNIQCPQCRQIYEVEESCSGQKVQCPCGNEFEAEPQETTVWAGSPSQRSNIFLFLFPAAAFLAGTFLFLTPFLSDVFEQELYIGGGAGLWVLAVLLFLYVWKSTSRTIFTITTRRISLRTGIFGSEERYANLSDIRNLAVNHGFIDGMLGIGNVSVYTAGSTDEQIHLYGIKNYRDVAALIEKLRKTA